MSYYIVRGAIVNLTGTTRNATSIILQWSAPPCPNGPIVGYHVYYRKGNHTQSKPISSLEYVSIFKNFSSISSSMIIDNLTSSETYTFHVRALSEENEPGLVDTEVAIKLDSQLTLGDELLQAVFDGVQSGSTHLTIGLPSQQALASIGITNIM